MSTERWYRWSDVTLFAVGLPPAETYGHYWHCGIKSRNPFNSDTSVARESQRIGYFCCTNVQYNFQRRLVATYVALALCSHIDHIWCVWSDWLSVLQNNNNTGKKIRTIEFLLCFISKLFYWHWSQKKIYFCHQHLEVLNVCYLL